MADWKSDEREVKKYIGTRERKRESVLYVLSRQKKIFIFIMVKE